MRLFLIVLTLLLQANAFALSAKTTPSFEHPSLFALADFQDSLQQEGFWSVDTENTGVADVMHVDQIFTDSALEQTIYLKLGLQQFEFGTFNKVASGIAYQGQTPAGDPFVLFFDQIPLERAKEIAKHAERPDLQAAKASTSRMNVALRLLIPRAEALSTCPRGPLQNQVAGALNDLDGILGFRALSTCAMTVLKSAGHTVASPFESLYKLVNDPAKYWEDTKQEWQKLKGFVLNVRTELTNFFRTLDNVDADILREIACSVIGQVAAGAGMTILTAGAAAGAAAKISLGIATMISKLNRLKSVLQTLSRMKQLGRVRSIAGATEKVMSCAVH
jgi:hypothetical protein